MLGKKRIGVHVADPRQREATRFPNEEAGSFRGALCPFELQKKIVLWGPCIGMLDGFDQFVAFRLVLGRRNGGISGREELLL